MQACTLLTRSPLRAASAYLRTVGTCKIGKAAFVCDPKCSIREMRRSRSGNAEGSTIVEDNPSSGPSLTLEGEAGNSSGAADSCRTSCELNGNCGTPWAGDAAISSLARLPPRLDMSWLSSSTGSRSTIGRRESDELSDAPNAGPAPRVGDNNDEGR